MRPYSLGTTTSQPSGWRAPYGLQVVADVAAVPSFSLGEFGEWVCGRYTQTKQMLQLADIRTVILYKHTQM